MMIGFKYKTLKGLILKEYVCSCPICKKKVEILTGETVTIRGGYKIKKPFSCSCGYASNFIIEKENKITKSQQFKRTCKECGKVWRFNYNDVLSEGVKATRNVAKGILGVAGSVAGLLTQEQINEPCRCSECGSRKVIIEIE